MTAYWLMFIPVALMALNERVAISMTSRRLGFAGVLTVLLFALMIGYRYQVGGDWYNYIRIFNQLRNMTLDQLIQYRLDIGYGILNSFSDDMGWGIIGVNVICGAIFSLGLVVFCRQQPRPWLALLVSIPYLVVVVGMGYTRQGVAIGLAMLGLAALARKSNIGFALCILLAATFHKSAVVLLPIAVLATTEKKIWTAIWVSVLLAVSYVFILQDSVERFVSSYLEAQMQSQGALIRVVMNALPAAIFLALRDQFDLVATERRLWSWMSLIAIASLFLLFGLSASTAVDRMALYLIPLQLFVLARLPDAMARLNISPQLITSGIVSYSAAVLFVWLNFAAHSYAWVPYQFYPLVGS